MNAARPRDRSQRNAQPMSVPEPMKEVRTALGLMHTSDPSSAMM